MAKRSRNPSTVTGSTTDQQTFLKQFHDQNGSQTGYKQLSSDTLPADEGSGSSAGGGGGIHEYSRQNLSSPALPTLSATVATNSPTSPKMNGYSVVNGQLYRTVSAAYVPNGTQLTATHYHSGNGGGGHYASNISHNTTGGSKKTLLDLSRQHSAVQQTSPQASTNDSHHAYLLSTPKLVPSTLVSDPTLICTNLGCNGIRELLASLALMCILSLLMAFLALFFLQRSCQLAFHPQDDTNTASVNNSKLPRANSHIISTQFNQKIVTNAKEYMRVFQISVSLSTLTIALDLCCLFVCCIQFLSIVKLIKTPFGKKRSLEFIKKTSHIRVLSIGAFLVSIPIFFTGVILYTFVNFEEIPALITSVIIGVGIIFCGVASVQNVYLWQWEKTKASQDLQMSQVAALRSNDSRQQHPQQQHIYGTGQTYPLELSTLV